MKILHCCLANFYIDNFSYQENILTKLHKKQGNEVEIVASTETYLKNLTLGYIAAGKYETKDGIPISRLPYVKLLPHFISKKLRIYKGLKEVLKRFKPNIIFLHGCQFLSIIEIKIFAKENDVKVFVDSHTDFINSGTNWISKNILHRILYKWCAKHIEEVTAKFFGTLPVREKFLRDTYGINESKIELLPFGVDDSLFKSKNKGEIRKKTRELLEIGEDDFVIVTGGKIDKRKNILMLIDAFYEIKKPNVKLLLFGKPADNIKGSFMEKIKHPGIIYVNWIPSNDIHKYLLASDLACFPGTHSVLWEESVGLGIPCIFQKWEGITHVDLGGNCIFLNKVSIPDIKKNIVDLIENKSDFVNLKIKSEELGPKHFAYSEISKRAIGL